MFDDLLINLCMIGSECVVYLFGCCCCVERVGVIGLLGCVLLFLMMMVVLGIM